MCRNLSISLFLLLFGFSCGEKNQENLVASNKPTVSTTEKPALLFQLKDVNETGVLFNNQITEDKMLNAVYF